MRHKTREMLVTQRTQLLNGGLRGHLTEIGIIAAQGPRHAACELAELIEACDETIPFEVCEALAPLVVQLRNLDEAIARLDRTIAKLAQKDETARRLMSIPGFGPITASAMAATIQDTSSFAGLREFDAFLGADAQAELFRRQACREPFWRGLIGSWCKSAPTAASCERGETRHRRGHTWLA